MNGMLQHQELYDTEIQRRQQEAQQWAHKGTLGRLAASARTRTRESGRRTRLFAVASPMAVALGLLAIFS